MTSPTERPTTLGATYQALTPEQRPRLFRALADAPFAALPEVAAQWADLAQTNPRPAPDAPSPLTPRS